MHHTFDPVCGGRGSGRCNGTHQPTSGHVRRAAGVAQRSDLGLLGNLQRVVNLDAKVAASRVKFAVTKQQLHSRKFFSCTDRSGLPWFAAWSACRSQPGQGPIPRPSVQGCGRTACSQVGQVVNASREHKVVCLQPSLLDPFPDSISSCRCDLKLHRTLRFLLHDHRAGATWSPWQMSRTFRPTKSQPRSLLSTSRLNSAS